MRSRSASRRVESPAPGEVRLEVAYCGICGTDLHIAHGAMDRPCPDAAGHRPRDVRHGRRGRRRGRGLRPGDPVVVRPLDTRGRDAGRPGLQPHRPQAQVHRHRRPGRVPVLLDRARFHASRAARRPSTCALRRLPSRSPSPATTSRGEVAAGESGVVIGGGPIGPLIALVARRAERESSSRELNVARRTLAAELGLDVVDPGADDPAAVLETHRGWAPTWSSRSRDPRPACSLMTRLAAIRGRVVVVAIFPEPQPVALFDFFWKELELRGARVYEPEDFERRDRADRRRHPRPRPADHGRRAARACFRMCSTSSRRSATAMKILVDCRS